MKQNKAPGGSKYRDSLLALQLVDSSSAEKTYDMSHDISTSKANKTTFSHQLSDEDVGGIKKIKQQL